MNTHLITLMKHPLLTTGALSLALTCPASWGQDNSSDSNNVVTKTERKIIIKTSDGDDTNEIVIDDWDGNLGDLPKIIDAEVLSPETSDQVKRALKRGLFEQADQLMKDSDNPFWSGSGKAMLFGADGKSHEVEWDQEHAWDLFQNKAGLDLDEHWPQIAKGLKRAGIDDKAIERARGYVEAYTSPNKKHMIGVQCRTLDDSLQSQLGLSHGIIVEEVFDDSPAEAAGLEKHDILVEAGETKLKRVGDLIDAVQAAGVEQDNLTIALIRGGERQTIDLTPTKREHPHKACPGTTGSRHLWASLQP